MLSSVEALEDCLYLNVYTPLIPGDHPKNGTTQELYPVLFYIHGGSFRVGSAHTMTPQYLLENNVVLVTIQYRLSFLGFLTLETNEIPGNMGFLDMLLALEWVHDHIRYFNGDKDSVTLIGQSAGAAAVTFFLTSPLVREDLFHRAIIQSGSGLCDWSFENDTGLGRQFAEVVGCSSPEETDFSRVAQCLRRRPLSELYTNYLKSFLFAKDENLLCQAIKQHYGKKKFLTEYPAESFARQEVKNVPVLIGITKHEGSSFLEEVFDFLWEDPFIDNVTDFKPQDLALMFTKYTHTDIGNTALVTQLVESQYFSQPYTTLRDVLPAMSDLAAVAVLKSCVFQTARILSSIHNSTYLYSFHFKGRFSRFFEYRTEARYPIGVAHSDDLVYLFWDEDKPLNDRELKVARTMVNLWTSFARHGYPFSENVPAWRPMDNNSVGPYLRIDETSELRDNFLEEFTIATREGVDVYFTGGGHLHHSNVWMFCTVLVLCSAL